MKKIFSLLALLALVLCLCSCGKDQATGALLLDRFKGTSASSAATSIDQPESAQGTASPAAVPTPAGEASAPAATQAPAVAQTPAPTPAPTAQPATPATADIPLAPVLFITGGVLFAAALVLRRRRI